ncbi:DNA-directed RNA polymerase III subunit RPC9 [Blattella germanica]|nr:DNA-directed RNA polymerase III subunit RPC9 [Blattella germanica]
MGTVNPNAAVLSNYEVLTLLQELRGQQKRSNTRSQLATITYETIKYLQDTPCSQQSPEIIRNFLKALEPFKLTKAEKVMLLNNPPTTPLEIQLMVEESEERLTDEQVEALLQIVVDCKLASAPSAQEEEAGGEEEEEGE